MFSITLHVHIVMNRSLIVDIVIGHVTMLSLPCRLGHGPEVHQADRQTLRKQLLAAVRQVADGQQLTIY